MSWRFSTLIWSQALHVVPSGSGLCGGPDQFAGDPDGAASEAPKSKSGSEGRRPRKALWWLTLCLCKGEDVMDEAACLALDEPRYEEPSSILLGGVPPGTHLAPTSSPWVFGCLWRHHQPG